MPRRLFALATLCALGVGTAAAQTARFPDTPHGKLAEGFFAALNAPTEDALAKFQEANFSEAALDRRPTEERLSLNRQIREGGTMTLVEVVSESESELVLTATVSSVPRVTLRVVFGFTEGPDPKIDTLQVSEGPP